LNETKLPTENFPNSAGTSLSIGSLTLHNPLILAPMAGVTDMPMRLLCSELGAGLSYMEMVSAKAICYQDQKTKKLLDIHPKESPTALQLFGSEPDVLAEAAKRLEELPFSVLDFNMGCPVPKIVNNKEGSALMKNPPLAERILTAMVKAVKKPVTVKIRKGFDNDHINAVEIAKIAESCGVSAIAVHGRTREEFYSGKADWQIIRAVKEAVDIPVIGNGDVTDARSAKQMIGETGCDGIMVGRGAQGNPWIFREIAAYLERGELLPPPTLQEKGDMAFRHAALMLEAKGEYLGVRQMRKILSWYTAGMPHSAACRKQIHTMESPAEMFQLMESIFHA
jgi:nifR3 family TIM-barrel protein